MFDRKNRGTVFSILLVTAVLVSLSNIPLIYAYLNPHPGQKFMGIIAGIRDANYYLMMMAQTKGWWPILKNYFASGEPDAIYHGFFWFLMGRIIRFLNCGELIVYHGVRIAAAIFFVPLSYWVASRFLRARAERMTAMIMLALGAGVGWIPMLWYRQTGNVRIAPADIATPEASSFFTFMTFPHLSITLLLIAACFGFLQVAVSERKMWPAAIGGVIGFALGLIHTVNLIVIYAALGSFALVSFFLLRESWPIRAAITFVSLSVWSIAYYIYLMLANPALLPQAPVRSPNPLSYALGFLPFLLLSGLYLIMLIKKRILPRGDLLLICWAVTNILLLYSYPLLSQEARAVLGLQIPLVILSARAIWEVIVPLACPETGSPGAASRSVRGYIVAALILAFTFPSTVYNIVERVSRLKMHPEAFALPLDDYDALRFLRGTPGEGVVLSGDWIGNYVPRLAHKRSWLGQYDLPSHDSRLEMAKTVFSSATPSSARHEILKRNSIGFIYYGRYERRMGGFNPDGVRFLEDIFQNSSVSVYRFAPEGASESGF